MKQISWEYTPVTRRWSPLRLDKERSAPHSPAAPRPPCLLWLQGSLLENAELAELAEHHGCAHAFRRSLDLVKTKCDTELPALGSS